MQRLLCAASLPVAVVRNRLILGMECGFEMAACLGTADPLTSGLIELLDTYGGTSRAPARGPGIPGPRSARRDKQQSATSGAGLHLQMNGRTVPKIIERQQIASSDRLWTAVGEI